MYPVMFQGSFIDYFGCLIIAIIIYYKPGNGSNILGTIDVIKAGKFSASFFAGVMSI